MFDLEPSIAAWRRQLLAAGILSPAALDELEGHLREEIERQIKSGVSAETAFQTAARQIGQPRHLKTEFNKNFLLENKAGIFTLLACLVIILRVLMVHNESGPVWKGESESWILFASLLLFWAVGTVFFGFRLGEIREIRLWKLVAITYSAAAVWVTFLPVLVFLKLPRFAAAFDVGHWTLFVLGVVASLSSVFVWRWGCRLLPCILNLRHRLMLGIVGCLIGPGAMGSIIFFYLPQIDRIPGVLRVILLAWAWAMMAGLAGLGYGLAEAAERANKDAASSHRHV